MDKNTDYSKKYSLNKQKKRQNAQKSINNYLTQLKMHFEISDDEMVDILKLVAKQHKKIISSKKWWHIFD